MVCASLTKSSSRTYSRVQSAARASVRSRCNYFYLVSSYPSERLPEKRWLSHLVCNVKYILNEVDVLGELVVGKVERRGKFALQAMRGSALGVAAGASHPSAPRALGGVAPPPVHPRAKGNFEPLCNPFVRTGPFRHLWFRGTPPKYPRSGALLPETPARGTTALAYSPMQAVP